MAHSPLITKFTMRTDRVRWDQKYARGNPNPDFLPDPVLKAHAHLFTSGGVALDTACGVGHNALYLAKLGYEVFAVDVSLTGLKYGQAEAKKRDYSIQFSVVDLNRFVPPPMYFDLIIVVKYLNRELIPHLKATLKRGGLIFYRTFNRNHITAAPSFNPDYLLLPGELNRLFEDFERIETNDAVNISDHETYWIGRRSKG